MRLFEPPDSRKPCRSCVAMRWRTFWSSIAGEVAASIGFKISARQWSQLRPHAPAVIENDGKLFLPQPLSSVLA